MVFGTYGNRLGGKNLLMMFILQLYPFLCLNFVLTEKMREPDDQDSGGRKSDRLKGDGRQTHSSRSTSRGK